MRVVRRMELTFPVTDDWPAFDEPLHVGRPNIPDPAAFLELVAAVCDRRWLSNDGPLVRKFEERIAAYIGVKHVIAICNGTVALEIAIRAAGLTGEIIVPSYTFVATAHAVRWQGLTPIFADIDPATHCLDPDAVAELITPKTSGIIATHVWGRAAPVAALRSIADAHGVTLMFDAAHAFGVSHGGTMIGCFGDAEVFSFHATKFLNSLEGGAIATNDDALAARMRLMRNFGFAGEDDVVFEGTNGKMNEVCAAMGLVNLDNAEAIVSANHANYEAYRERFEGVQGLHCLSFAEGERQNYQYIVVEIGSEFGEDRDDVWARLKSKNILARRYFWPGCHRMLPYRSFMPWANKLLPMTNEVARRVIVLPTGTAVTPEVATRVADIVRAGR